jgi:hypothetical protein
VLVSVYVVGLEGPPESESVDEDERKSFGCHGRILLAVAHHVKVLPVRLRERDAGLGCDRLRGIGFRAVCECGERGSVVGSVSHARAWSVEHRDSVERGSSSATPDVLSG